MNKRVQVIVTLVLHLEEKDVQDKLVEVQNKIKDIKEIQEYGFNIYDILDLNEIPNVN